MSAERGEELQDCIVEYAGMRVKTKCMPGQGIYLCPICFTSGHMTMFYSEKDLIHHLIAHAEGLVHVTRSRGGRTRSHQRTLLGSRTPI